MMKRLANLLEVGAILSLAVVVAGAFGKWHFLLDLGSHFRFQATGTLLLAGLLLLTLKRRRWGIVSLVAGVVLAATLIPFFGVHNSANSASYRLLTMNVLTNNPRRKLVIDYIIASDPDFVVLQETSSQWISDLNDAIGAQWPYRETVARSDNFGISLYSKMPFSSCEIIEYPAPLPTPTISAVIQTPHGDTLRLIATHPLPPMNDACWHSRNSLFSALAEDIRSNSPQRTIVAGDLNCSPWSYWFKDLLARSDLSNS